MGILIKGPIILIFTILPLCLFSFVKKRNYLKSIWSTFGFLLLICISLPWFILINHKSGGLFWYESIGNDLFEKSNWKGVTWLSTWILYFITIGFLLAWLYIFNQFTQRYKIEFQKNS